ncbi:ribonuclease R [Pacificimonas flava]|uniref:Ribonuclease R n=1 Tax=Pacificimonas flava TaxID=1234595 RepID=M2TPN7_9SPHN|nr:ribonuclease R [Pacificimonas flava]EMD83736.1 3'-to-5' exoribonuclease RNase R [Pacificimonas flava]MBB5280583.1 ribonuclease R [Pacificimonas flava]
MNQLPSRAEILEFVRESSGPVGKREIAKAFGIRGDQRRELREFLNTLAEEGVLEIGRGKSVHEGGGLPKVTVLQVTHVDDGRPFAVPVQWDHPEPPPRVLVREKKGGRALGEGDRILARIEDTGRGYRGHLMKRIGRASEEVLGILRADERGHFLQPVDKRMRKTFAVDEIGDARPGDLVLAQAEGRRARVTQRLGDPFEPRSISLIAIHAKGLPHIFSDGVLAAAEKAAEQPLGEKREDLRHLPFVTIDPEDARDHDDALWAEADGNGGWNAVVAIADVSFYVRTGSPIDKEARKRGNSAYFPDRVVPMLPEVLSAGACSLVEQQDRAALVCHLNIAQDGTLSNWRFARALIRCKANIAYEEAADYEGLEPLWEAWRALFAARQRREPLELDIPERRVELDARGKVVSIGIRERLDAHRLVEDYMIAANVAAAKALEKKRSPVVYRAHETPGREKIDSLRDYLKTLGVPFAKGQVIQPSLFNRMLDALTDPILREQVSTEVLRTQTQAYYTPDNMGHFGLSLASYAHFTSPIRRYSDLLVHRALVRAYDLGPGGLTDAEEAELPQITEHISQTERRAMEAERDTTDRYVAAYLSERAGETVTARITGVTKHGIFATVDGVGGDGLLPMRALGQDYFRFDEVSRTIEGERSGTVYSIGQRLDLRIAEANPITGGLVFELPDGASASSLPTRGKPSGKRVGKGRKTPGTRPPKPIRKRGRRKS